MGLDINSRKKLRKCFDMMQSDHDGEVVAAAKAVTRIINGTELENTFNDIDKMRKILQQQDATIRKQQQAIDRLVIIGTNLQTTLDKVKSKRLVRMLAGL